MTELSGAALMSSSFIETDPVSDTSLPASRPPTDALLTDMARGIMEAQPQA
jgi:hypothetical protein